MRGIVAVLFLALFSCEPKGEYISTPNDRQNNPTRAPRVEDAIKKARAYYNTGRLDDAIAAGQLGLSLDSTAVELYNLVATAYAGQGRYALAIEALHSALRFQPDYSIAYVNLGGIYTKLGQYAAAEENLLRALEINPDDSALCRRLSEVYLGTNRYDEAIDYLQRGLHLLPASATFYFYLGKAFEANGRSEKALQSFARATVLDIGFAKAWYRVAVLAGKLGYEARADSALQRFEKLQRIAGGNAEILKKKERLRAAVMNLPENYRAHYKLGLFFAAHHYHAEALNKLKRASQLEPDHPLLLSQIGELLVQEERPLEALDYFERALEQEPDLHRALLRAGKVSTLLEHHEKALKYYRRSIDAAPQEPEGWYLLGAALLQSGQRQEAAQTLRVGLGFVRQDSLARRPFEDLLATLRE